MNVLWFSRLAQKVEDFKFINSLSTTLIMYK